MKLFFNFFQGLFILSFPSVVLAQVGSTAPDFTVTDSHGAVHTLYDYLEAGKVVVLDFYYTTCGPCQFYSPQANLAYEKYGCNNANVFFMSIDYDDTNAEVIAYDAEYEIKYPSISGLEGGGNAVVNQYNIIGFPTFYVIDSTKKIIDEIDPPTLQVFDFRFNQHGIQPAECSTNAVRPEMKVLHGELFPNPVDEKGILNVRLSDANSGGVQFDIFNQIGQLVERGQPDLSNSQSIGINIDHLSPGMYFLKVCLLDDGRVYSGVFLKE